MTRRLCRVSGQLRLAILVTGLAVVALSAGGIEGQAAVADATAHTARAAGGCSTVTPLTISYNAPVGDELPVWIADDAGYFAKNCLDATIVNLTGNSGPPALLSGKTQVMSSGSDEVMSVKAAGADIKVILSLMPILPFQLWVWPKYDSASALEGQRIGISTFTGSIYTGTLLALKALGLTQSDVQLVPLGAVPNVASALLSGSVAAAVNHPPGTLDFQKKGLKMLVDLVKQETPSLNTGLVVENSFIQQHPDVVQRVVTSVMEGLQRAKRDKAFTEQEIRKYLHVTDQDQADVTYDFYITRAMPAIPMPTAKQLQLSQQQLSATNASVGQVDLGTVIDQRFVQRATQMLFTYRLASKLGPRQLVRRPKVHSAGRATLSGTLTPSGTLKWKLATSKLTGPVTRIELHVGKPGHIGSAKLKICGPCRHSGSKVVRSESVQQQIKTGKTYVVVSTKKNPRGEVRGQLKAKLG